MNSNIVAAPDFSKQLANCLEQKKTFKNKKLKTEALAEFNNHGLPGRKYDDWLYTQILPQTIANLSLAPTKTTLKSLTKELNCYLIDYNNVSNIKKDLPFKYTLTDKIKIDIAKSNTNTAFVNLNTALQEGCLKIDIPKNTVLSKPIVILYETTTENDNTMHHPRTIINIGEHSQISLIEYYYNSTKLNYLNNTVTEINIKQNTTLNHSIFEELNYSKTGQHIATHYINLADNCNLKSDINSINAGICRNNYTVNANGISNNIDLYSLIYSKNNSSCDLNLIINHNNINQTSNSTIRSAAQDKSAASCSGKIVVNKSAQNCDANLDNKSLLLSDFAKINNRPQLEIYNGEIKCSHGSTCSSFDPQSLFYLQSRGICNKTAKEILLYSFFSPIVNNAPVIYFKNRLIEKLELKTEHL